MRSRDDMTVIEFPIGDELVDAFAETGRAKALPVAGTNDWGEQVVKQPVSAFRPLPFASP